MFPWIWDKLTWKKSVLVRSEILGLFFNTSTPEFQYYRRNMQNFPQQLQTQLSQKRKASQGFLLRFWNVHQVLKILIKKLSLLAKVYPKLLTPNEVETQMSKRHFFRTSFGKQCVSGFEALLQSPQHRYYRMFPWIWDKLSWKNSVLVRSEILGLFVNTLTGEYMYSLRKIQNFPHQLHMQLSQKRKAIPRFFIAFLKGTLTL